MSTRRTLTALLLVLLAAPAAFAQIREQALVKDAGVVLTDITRVPEKGIPVALLQEAQAIMIFPDVLKAGLIVGGRHGHGVVFTRNEQGLWGFPALLTIT